MAFPLSWREKNQALDNEQNIGSLLDGCEPFVALLPDTVQNLNLAVTGNQYNELFASLLTGVELVYPEKYLELIALFLQAAQCSPILPSENECYEYPSYAPFISYEPTSPFIDNGFSIIYPVAPFFLWSAIDTWLPNWIDDLFFGLISNATGYQDNDILISYLSQPLIANPFNGLDYPEIQIHVNGEGTARIHLLQIPYGGRAIISVDDPPDLTDLASAVFTDNDRIIELNRDFTSFPPETDVDTIEDIEITGEGEHTIYISFVPTIDFDNALFLQFGGGFRSVELCGFGQSGVIMGITDMRRVGEKLEVLDNGVWLEKVDLAPLHTGLQNQITANDNDIAALQNVDSNQQAQISGNDADILAIQNVNTTQSNDIIALYAENDVQDADTQTLQNNVVSLQGQITTNLGNINDNDTDIAALQATDIGLQNQINLNDGDILALQLENARLNSEILLNDNDISTLQAQDILLDNRDDNQAVEIANHDTRITTLENAPTSGGSGGGIIPTVYAKTNLTLYRSSNSTPLLLSDLTQSHVFTLPNALITCAILAKHNVNSGTAWFKITVNGVDSDTFQTGNFASNSNVLISGVFDGLDTVNPTDLELYMWSSGGQWARVETGRIVMWQVIEYSTANPILNSPLIDFENPDLYTLTALQDGTIQTGGNSGLCLRENPVSSGGYSSFEVDFGKVQTVTNIDFQWWVTVAGNQVVYVYGDGALVYQYLTMQGNDAVWILDNIPFGANFDCQVIRFHCATIFGNDFRLDNFQIDTL